MSSRLQLVCTNFAATRSCSRTVYLLRALAQVLAAAGRTDSAVRYGLPGASAPGLACCCGSETLTLRGDARAQRKAACCCAARRERLAAWTSVGSHRPL
eukprot:4162644-Heterocapsa_arctica.AAC.1